jgi:hypothetical protein
MKAKRGSTAKVIEHEAPQTVVAAAFDAFAPQALRLAVKVAFPFVALRVLRYLPVIETVRPDTISVSDIPLSAFGEPSPVPMALLVMITFTDCGAGSLPDQVKVPVMDPAAEMEAFGPLTLLPALVNIGQDKVEEWPFGKTSMVVPV